MKAAKARLETPQRGSIDGARASEDRFSARPNLSSRPKSSTPRKKVKDSQNSTPRKKSAPQVVLLDGRYTPRPVSTENIRTVLGRGPSIIYGGDSARDVGDAEPPLQPVPPSEPRPASSRPVLAVFGREGAGLAGFDPTASTRKAKEARAATLDDAGIMARALADAEAYNKRSRDEFDRLMVISEEKQIELEATTELARALAVPGLVEEEELGANHPQVLKANKLAQLKEQLAAADQDTHDAEEYTHTLQYMLNCQRDAHAVERGRLGDLREGKEEVDAQHAEAKLLHGKAVLQMTNAQKAAAEGARTVEGNVVYYDDLLAKKRGDTGTTSGVSRGGGSAGASRASPDAAAAAAAALGGSGERRPSKEEELRRQLVATKMSSLVLLQERDQHVEQVSRYEAAFLKMARVAGSSDPDAVIHKFLTRNEVRARFLAERDGARTRLAALETDNRRLREKLSDLTHSLVHAPEADGALRLLEPKLDASRGRVQNLSDKISALHQLQVEVSAGVGHVLRLIAPALTKWDAQRESAKAAAAAAEARESGEHASAAASGAPASRQPTGGSTASGAAPMDHQLEVPEPAPPPAPTLPPEHPYQRDGARARQRRESPQLPSYHLPRRSSSTGSAAAAAASRRERIAERSAYVDAAYLSLVSLPQQQIGSQMTADQLLDSLSQCEVRVAKVLRLVQDAVGGGRDAVEHELALRRRSSVQGELARRSSVGAAGGPSGAARRRASNAARVGAADIADAYNIRVKPPEQINAALALDDDDAAMKKAIDEVLPKIEVVPTRESLKHESEKAVRNQQRAQAKARRKSSK